MEAIFTNIYNKNHWGNNYNSNYSGSSGGGSDVTYNKEYIIILRKIINDLKINKIVIIYYKILIRTIRFFININ